MKIEILKIKIVGKKKKSVSIFHNEMKYFKCKQYFRHLRTIHFLKTRDSYRCCGQTYKQNNDIRALSSQNKSNKVDFESFLKFLSSLKKNCITSLIFLKKIFTLLTKILLVYEPLLDTLRSSVNNLVEDLKPKIQILISEFSKLFKALSFKKEYKLVEDLKRKLLWIILALLDTLEVS